MTKFLLMTLLKRLAKKSNNKIDDNVIGLVDAAMASNPTKMQYHSIRLIKEIKAEINAEG